MPEPLYNPEDDPLAGMFCPACGHTGSFRIGVAAMLDLASDGSWDMSDPEWDDESFIQCPSCSHDGIVANFHHDWDRHP